MCFFQTGTVYIGKQWEEMGMGMQQGFPANFLSKPTHPRKGTTKYLQKFGLKNGVAPSFSGTQMCGKRCAAGDAMVGGKLGVSPLAFLSSGGHGTTQLPSEKLLSYSCETSN
jgi:hypothetical protein